MSYVGESTDKVSDLQEWTLNTKNKYSFRKFNKVINKAKKWYANLSTVTIE